MNQINCISNDLEPLQFAYSHNTLGTDVISLALHPALNDLTTVTHTRQLFVDHSTIVLSKSIIKLQELGR